MASKSSKKAKKVDLTFEDPRDFEGKDDSTVLQRVLTDLFQSETNQQSDFDRFTRYYQLYRSYIPKDQRRKHGANLFIPYVFNIVETALPRIVSAMLNNRPFLVYKPVTVAQADKAQKMTSLVDFQIHQRMRAVGAYVDIVKSACIYGTAISKQTWKFEERKFVQRVDKPVYDETGNLITVQKVPVLMQGVKYDAPFMENVPLEDFYFEPYATSIEDSSYAIHRYWEPLHSLMQKQEQGIYRNVDKIGSSVTTRQSGVDRRLSSIGRNTKNVRNSVEIHEYWTDDWKVVVANRSTVLQVEENPFWHRRKPFSRWIDIPLANEFYGMGEVEVCESLQNELNTTRNQRIDNVTFMLNRMFKILRAANIDPDQLVSRPNGFVEVDTMDDIAEIKFDDVTQSAYNEEEIIKQDMNDTTGVHNYDRGAPATRRETATTASILAQSSGERFKLKVTVIEDGGFADSGMQIAELNRQFIDRNIEIRITNEDGQEIPTVVTPDDMDVDLDIVAVGSAVDPAANKEIRQNQLIQLINMTAGSPYINMPELLKEVFKAFDMDDVNRFILAPQPQAPETPIGGAPGASMGAAPPQSIPTYETLTPNTPVQPTGQGIVPLSPDDKAALLAEFGGLHNNG